MASARTVYRFGPFELDSEHRRLRRGLETVALPDRHVELLLLLAANAGKVVSKDILHQAGWQDVAVTDSSVIHAVGGLRKALGHQDDGRSYIETLSRRGYRFAAPVEHAPPPRDPVALDALLAPYRAFVDGRAALEGLNRDAIVQAREAFRGGLTVAADEPAGHIGLANACLLLFESTRADVEPDVTALQEADQHARAACRLAPSSGDAWGTLAVVCHRRGRAPDAIAAARKAVSLEPDNWHHHLSLASVSWGEQRIRAAHRVLALHPGLAFAHWFAATVFVARQAFDVACEELRAGCAAQDARGHAPGAFRAVGLHFLHALVLGARGSVDAALDELARELAADNTGHVYERECCANAWYASGALHLRLGRKEAAAAAFARALTHLPRHPLAAAGLALTSPSSHTPATPHARQTIDVVVAKAAMLAIRGRHHDAARLCHGALVQQPPGSAGWVIPVDPLLHVTARSDAWTGTLAVLGARAV